MEATILPAFATAAKLRPGLPAGMHRFSNDAGGYQSEKLPLLRGTVSPFVPQGAVIRRDRRMTQAERRIYLIKELLKERRNTVG